MLNHEKKVYKHLLYAISSEIIYWQGVLVCIRFDLLTQSCPYAAFFSFLFERRIFEIITSRFLNRLLS